MPGKPKFVQESVAEAVERSLRNAPDLRMKHAATVAALRALARKIDAWDVIVEWALDDAAADGTRPAVPQNDNVSLATFLKYCHELGLVPEEQKVDGRVARGKPVPGETANPLAKWRNQHAV